MKTKIKRWAFAFTIALVTMANAISWFNQSVERYDLIDRVGDAVEYKEQFNWDFETA